MKTLLYGDFNQKYKNKLKYLTHIQLLEEFSRGTVLMIRVNLFLYVGFYLLLHDYPIFLASLDFSFAVLSAFFMLVLRPMMLKGKIPAFYRRDYQTMRIRLFLMKFFIQGGAMRFPILALYYIVTFFLIKDNPIKVEEYQKMIWETIYNPIYNGIAIVSFFLAIYFLFYQERYTTIRDYSNGVVEIYSRHSMTEEEAVRAFIQKRDRELELENMNGVKYDGVLSQSNSNSTSLQQNPSPSTHQPNVSQTNKKEFGEEGSIEIVRRRARR